MLAEQFISGELIEHEAHPNDELGDKLLALVNCVHLPVDDGIQGVLSRWWVAFAD